MGKYLVTGAAGYVAGTLVRELLQEGHKVLGMDNLDRGNCDSLIALTKNPNFEFMRGDITSCDDVRKALKNVDGVFHLAAVVGNPACVQSPTWSRMVNVEGTKNLLHLKKDNQRLVFCSTECVYGNVYEYKEDIFPNPTAIYAEQKFDAELDVGLYPNTVIFRFAAAMGLSQIPRINLLVNTLVYEAITNKCLVVFEQDIPRNFINVNDMVSTLTFGMFDSPKELIYNAGNISWSKRQIAEYISKKTGCYVFYGNVNSDPDKRDKKLDNKRLLAEDFKFNYTMEETIDELLKGLPLLNIKHNYQ